MKDQPIDNGFYMATFINEHKETWSVGMDYKDGKWVHQGKEYKLEPIEWDGNSYFIVQLSY